MKRILLFLIICSAIWQWSCVKERINTSAAVNLEFSVDTLHFDTVFTAIGSATRSFKIYNRESDDIILDAVYLDNAPNSSFRINVDGLEGPRVEEVRIGGKDSIYVFVEVTVDPDQPISVSPFVIEEYIRVDVNGGQKSLLIDAWGQNANYIPNRFNRTQVYRLDCATGTVVWDDPKPYVIYGLVVIDSCVLNILAGTQIHIHGGIGRIIDTAGNVQFFNDGNIIVGPQGRIIASGNKDNPIVFQGDRLEPQFDQTPGQWNGIRILPTSQGNQFSHTVIKNSVYGIYADSLVELTLRNSAIFNTTSVGLFGFHVQSVQATNCLFYNNGSQSIAGVYGGQYDFTYTTVANFGNDREGVFLSNNFCYDFPECENHPSRDLNANFVNSIITGSNPDEYWMSRKEEALFELSMQNCLIKIDELLDPENIPGFLNTYTLETINRRRTDSLFADLDMGDLRPDTLSILEERAIPIRGINDDLDGNLRDLQNPDLGCYEYQY